MTTEPASRRARRDRRLDGVRLLLGVVSCALLALLVWQVFASKDDADQARSETRTLAQQVTQACDSGGAAAQQLEAIGACRKAAVAAIGAPTIEERTVIQVATDDQVRASVVEYLRANPPRDGRTPTDAEVEAAVARVCGSIGCRGEPGDDGAAGVDGTNGLDGANASDEQVSQQVADYCDTHQGCRPTQDQVDQAIGLYCSEQPEQCAGPPGATGPAGPASLPLDEYYETVPTLGGTVTRHCVRQGTDMPARYDCTGK